MLAKNSKLEDWRVTNKAECGLKTVLDGETWILAGRAIEVVAPPRTFPRSDGNNFSPVGRDTPEMLAES